MTIHSYDVSRSQFSTRGLPPDERWPAFLALSRTVGKVECTPLDPNLVAEGKMCRLPMARIASFSTSAMRANRSRAMGEGADDLVFYMCEGGAGDVSHLGRDETVSAGESVLATFSDSLSMMLGPIRYSSVTIPRSVLAPLIADIDKALMTPMPSTSEAIRLLGGYTRLLLEQPAGSELGAMAAAHMHDLVALAIGATRDAAEIANGRGLRAERMRAIKADIAQNLASGGITSQALARRHGISPRYIRKLFEREGTSLSEFVRNRRLDHVHRMLGHPRQAGQQISSLVYDAGFGDLSTFNHAFRKHYGMTPSDVRAIAGKDAA